MQFRFSFVFKSFDKPQTSNTASARYAVRISLHFSWLVSFQLQTDIRFHMWNPQWQYTRKCKGVCRMTRARYDSTLWWIINIDGESNVCAVNLNSFGACLISRYNTVNSPRKQECAPQILNNPTWTELLFMKYKVVVERIRVSRKLILRLLSYRVCSRVVCYQRFVGNTASIIWIELTTSCHIPQSHNSKYGRNRL
jgi:hypothetical protein